MRKVWAAIGLAAASAACWAQANSGATEDAGKLVREVVYNELHEHAGHGYFRYWVERKAPEGTNLEEQVETAEGPVARTVETNGRPMDGHGAELEETRLEKLRYSPSEQAAQRAAYQRDESRVGRILALLPDAFVYRDEGISDGLRHLRYEPNPKYTARGVEARVFHGMSGDLWIDLRAKRMRRLEGRLSENVEFGYGLLGSVEKGGWFRLVRTEVSASDWKTEQFELHVSGRALLCKTLLRNTSEMRGGFEAVPARMSLAQGLDLLENPAILRDATARVMTAGMGFRR